MSDWQEGDLEISFPLSHAMINALMNIRTTFGNEILAKKMLRDIKNFGGTEHMSGCARLLFRTG